MVVICNSERVAAAAKSLQSCPTVCDPMDSSPAGSSIHRILYASILGGLPFPSPQGGLGSTIGASDLKGANPPI